ncbi:MAG: amino acid ABC transporter permease [Rhodospirillaceae bacterium]
MAPAQSKAAASGASAGGNGLLRLWNDKEARSVIFQIMTVVGVFAFLGFIGTNAIANLERVGKTFSFDFLGFPASYDINQHLIEYTSQSTHMRAGLVGLLNTLLVAGCGVVLASILGFILGVLRLSHNWLITRIVYVFIEFTRNVPVLLHILLIHGLIVHSLPQPRQAISLGDEIFLSNRGFFIPKPIFHEAFWFTVVALVIAVIGVVVFRSWARKRQEETGHIYPVFWIGLGAIVGLPLVAFLVTGAPVDWEVPKMGRFNLRGGLVVLPEFLALWLALSLYTSAFIAEIVRAGILAVSHGQWEAAMALGVRRSQILNLIIIPQALRVIVPPLTSQYLNLTKNSSLAVAIGYMDIVATLGGISLMQTGKEMETMMIVLSIYLVISLLISSVMNWYNKRIKLVER